MTIEEYKAELLSDVEKFIDYWVSQTDKQVFPESMDLGDWDEQFRIFTTFDGDE